MVSQHGSGAVPEQDPAFRRLLIIGLIGGAVALTLGIYGSAHTPSSDLTITLGFSNTIVMKVWLTTIAVFFAVIQLLSALWMYGKLPLGHAPDSLGTIHRRDSGSTSTDQGASTPSSRSATGSAPRSTMFQRQRSARRAM